MKRSATSVTRSLRIPSIFAIAVAVTVVLAAAATVRGSAASLSLLLLRVPDFAVVGVWVVSAFGFGAATLTRSTTPVDRPRLNRPLRIVTSTAIGLGIESVLVLALGLLGFINGFVSWGILVAGGLLALWNRRMLFQSFDAPGVGARTDPHLSRVPQPRERPLENAAEFARWLWLFPIAVMTISGICAMLPPGLLWGDEPNGYDVVEYHLQVPREWYEIGRIVPLTHNVFSYFPFNVEMHYLLAMMACHGPWAGMYVAQLMHGTFILLTVVAVYGLLLDRSRTAAIIAAAAMAATPWCGLLASVAYDEGGYLLWSTLAIGLLLRREVVLAGMMAGLACGAKWTSVPMMLLAVPLIILLMRIVRWRSVLLYCAIGSAVVSPWLIRNIAWARNPVFPEITAVFGQADWSETKVKRWHDAHMPRADQTGIVAHLKALNEQVIGDWRYGFILLPAAIVAAALGWRERSSVAIVLIVAALSVFWLFFTHLQGRFFVLVVPLASLLIGIAAARWPSQSGIAVAAVAAIGLSLLMRRVLATDSRLFQLIGAVKLDGFTPFADSPPAEDASVVLIGDAKAFWYQLPTSRLFYRTVFDVDVKPGETVVDAWARGTPTNRAARVLDPGELARFSRTYAGIPLPPMNVSQLPGPTIDWGTASPAKSF